MTDLAELMSRDPLGLSNQDLDAIILRLRQARAQYKLGSKSAGNPKKTTATKTKTSQIDLEALGLISSSGPKLTAMQRGGLEAAAIDLEALGLITPAGETGEKK